MNNNDVNFPSYMFKNYAKYLQDCIFNLGNSIYE